jgi:glycosyltransferase involved in cell wall biosynthesis
MDRPLRVLHVIPSIGPLRGGPSVAMRALARALARAGVDVHVATTDDNGLGRLGVRLGRPVDEDGATLWYFRRQTRFYTTSWALTRWLASNVADYDLMHIHALFSYAAVPASVLARQHGVPYIVRPLGTLNRFGMETRRPRLKRLSYRLIERRILAGAARVHYTSEAERREAATLGAQGRPVVIPHGIDLEAFRKLPPRGWIRRRAPHLAGRTIILFLSRIDPKKGLDLLLPAFARLRTQQPDVALVMAGDGEAGFIENLKAEAVRLGIDADLYWAGFLDADEKLAALADADLFVLPSYSENFGLSVVEAMASRLPVVISDEVAIHHEVAGGQAGLVTSCQVRSLTAALVSLVEDAGLRERLGHAGRRLVESRFSAEAMTTAVLGMYHEIIGRSAMRLAGASP